VEENPRQNKQNMILRAGARSISFPRRPLVMGILNINEDSFCSDGSLDPAWAVAQTRRLIAEGADIIDVGAESARTNRKAISEDEEIRRLRPLLREFARIAADSGPADDEQIFPPLLSINTWRPKVAEEALSIAGDLLNDMSGLTDSQNAEICARAGAALLIMHTLGEPKVPHTHVRWENLMEQMRAFFVERMDIAISAGLDRDALVLDPGLDFAKQTADSLQVLRELDHLTSLGRPLLVPVSRKGFIGETLDLPDPHDRDAGTVAAIAAAVEKGASIVRVHHVRAARQAILALIHVLAA